MAEVKISELPAATSVSNADVFPVVQGAVTKKVAASVLAHYATGTFHVEKYGAVGDGTTDDTAAIQDAIDAAHTAGGGVVFLTAGATHGITQITCKTGVTVDGQGATLKRVGVSVSTGGMIVAATSATDLRVRNLRVDGQGGNATYQTIQSRGLFWQGVTRAVVEGCVFEDTWQEAIRIHEGSTDVWVVRNRVVNTLGTGADAQHGIVFSTATADSTNTANAAPTTVRFVCADNVVSDTGASGIMLFCVAHGTVSGNVLRSCGHRGINIGPTTSDVAIAGNTVLFAGSTGIHGAHRNRFIAVTGNTVRGTVQDASGNGTEGQGIKFYFGCLDITISGNTVVQNATDGIALMGTAARVAITGNMAFDNGANAGTRTDGLGGDGVRLQAGDYYGTTPASAGSVSEVTVSGNVCRSNTGSGIRVFSDDGANTAEALTISGNVASLNTRYGLHAGALARYATVTGNTLTNNTLGPALVESPSVALSSNVTGTDVALVGADRGDTNVTLTLADAPTQVFATPLTTNRTVTLASAPWRGCAVRVVRTAAATGASTLSVGGLKTLAAGQWCDVAYNGSAWALVAFGSL